MTLRLPFDTDDPEFTRGVEIGLLWAALRDNPGTQVFTLHATNAEMILRVAEVTGRAVRSLELGEDWLDVRFEAVE